MSEGVRPSEDILAIAVVDESTARPVATCGTAFLIADGLAVTAWHCVRDLLKPGQRYVVCRKRGPDVYDPFPLSDIVQHPAGRDLALGRVPLRASQRFALFMPAVQPGMHVWTFGYPATQLRHDAHGNNVFALGPRYLEGYVTRTFIYPEGPGGPSPAHELDIQVPGGLSGAPIFFQGTDAILGVVFHAHEVETVESFSSVDPVTGERQPEIVRVIYFGLAYPLDTLLELRGPATDDRPLRELVSDVQKP